MKRISLCSHRPEQLTRLLAYELPRVLQTRSKVSKPEGSDPATPSIQMAPKLIVDGEGGPDVVTVGASEEARRALVTRQISALGDGERIEGSIGIEEDAGVVTPDEINKKYERGEIRIVTEAGRYPLDSITGLLKGNNYKLDPDYQRRHRWSVEQKSRLIESFIMNVPVPPIFLYEWDFNQYEVMDGLQRMTAVREFYEGAFALAGLEYWRELEGMRYTTLPSRIKAGIDRRYISSIILLKETSHGDEDPERLKRFVFGRINTGGVKLSAQEVRNALYDGPMNDLCKELSSCKQLRQLWGIPVEVEELVEHPERAFSDENMLDFDVDIEIGRDPVPEDYRQMVDVELVLRFFANRQRMVHYRDNLRDYLDDYLKAANNYEAETIAALRLLYTETLDLAWEIFGENAFRRTRNHRWGNEPKVSIYDALTNVLSRLISEKDRLVARKEDIVAGMDDFYATNSVRFNLRGQSRSDLMDREILFEEYLRSFI